MWFGMYVFGMQTIIHDMLNIKTPLLITYCPIYFTIMYIPVHGTLISFQHKGSKSYCLILWKESPRFMKRRVF